MGNVITKKSLEEFKEMLDMRILLYHDDYISIMTGNEITISHKLGHDKVKMIYDDYLISFFMIKPYDETICNKLIETIKNAAI